MGFSLSLLGGMAAADTAVYDDDAATFAFAPSSFWYTPIPYNAPLDPNSANYVTEFMRQFNTYYGTVAINTDMYSASVYTVDTSVPTVPVTQWNCQNKSSLDSGLKTQWAAVPVPAYAVSPADSDAEMVIYEPVTDTLWEFWKMQKVNGNWQACWGGRITNASTNNGIFPGYYGATATGLPLASGQITAEELQQGQINHVIGISLVDLANKDIFSWPAVRSDGYNPNGVANRIPEGTRIRLDPSIDINSLKLTPVGKIIAQAAQTYGFVVWDHAGAISLRVQNPLSYTSTGQVNPYPALFAGKANWAILQNFPWKNLQFLPMNYGKPFK